MICKACADGADLVSRNSSPGFVALAKESHGICVGCDCQHKVDAQVEGKALRR